MPYDGEFFGGWDDFINVSGSTGSINLTGWRKVKKGFEVKEIFDVKVGKWELEGCIGKGWKGRLGTGRFKKNTNWLWFESLDFNYQQFDAVDIWFHLCPHDTDKKKPPHFLSVHGYAFFDKKQPCVGVRFLLAHETVIFINRDEPKMFCWVNLVFGDKKKGDKNK